MQRDYFCSIALHNNTRGIRKCINFIFTFILDSTVEQQRESKGNNTQEMAQGGLEPRSLLANKSPAQPLSYTSTQNISTVGLRHLIIVDHVPHRLS